MATIGTGWVDGAWIQAGWVSGAWSQAATATITGTSLTEAQVVAGGESIVINLIGDTWDATVGADNAKTTALINGLDSDGAEATGWDAVVKAGLVFGDVTRDSDTQVTILLPAFATYDITADETITITVPATAVAGAAEITAAPTIDVTATAVVAAVTGGRRKKKFRYTVEVDGEIIEVASITEAEAVLAQVREVAEEKADQVVTTSTVPKPPRIRVKTASGKPTTSQTIQQATRRTQRAVNRFYIEAAKRRRIDEEISTLLIAKIETEEREEEDLLIALLLS